MDNIFIDKLMVPLIKAWNLFFEIPFPVSNSLNNQISSISSKSDDNILYAVPVVGLIVGIIAYVFILIIYGLFGTLLASILCSIVIILMCEILSYGRDTNNLVHALTNRSFAASRKSSEEQKSMKEGNYLYIYIFIAIFLLRIVCLGFIIYDHNFSWIIIITTLSLSTQGYLAIDSSDSLINIYDKNSIIVMWIISAAICVFFGWYFFAAAAIAYILTLLISIQLKKYLNNSNNLFGENIGVSGKYIEILVLIIGLIAIAQH
ncbi:MAG TPA: hypothetical protein QF753_16510 [Victivallales bacterium]|nr:hypothetical protein [Victivallales bacterium]